MTKKRYFFPLLALFLALGTSLVVVVRADTASKQSNCVLNSGTNTLRGTIGGADYIIQVPVHWKGTLVLYNHGFESPGPNKPAADAPGGQQMASTLLQEGYALAGSSYSQTGWAVQQAFQDDFALLDFFTHTCGQPQRTLTWGTSMGGLITAGLVQLAPQRFAGALSMCGVLGGSVGFFNQNVDSLFAFNVLLANSSLQIVYPPNPLGMFQQAQQILKTAQQTPQGRARTALFSALADLSGWFDPASPEPALTDYAAREQNQYLADQQNFMLIFGDMSDIKERTGGKPFWTNGVNYSQQLGKSVDRAEVEGLYKLAGLNLNADLATIQQAPPIYADKQAVKNFSQDIVFNGKLSVPVLTLHTTGDTMASVQDEQAYQSVVRGAGDLDMLRQAYIHRAGHCAFTSAEMLTALHTLVLRLDKGRWSALTDPNRLNAAAVQLGSQYNYMPPAFISYCPAPFMRPYDLRDE